MVFALHSSFPFGQPVLALIRLVKWIIQPLIIDFIPKYNERIGK